MDMGVGFPIFSMAGRGVKTTSGMKCERRMKVEDRNGVDG